MRAGLTRAFFVATLCPDNALSKGNAMETEAAETPLLSDVNDGYDRLTETELTNLGVVMGAVRMLRGNRRGLLAYVSMPITSGKRYFDVLSAHGAKDADELAAKAGKGALYELVIKPNIQEGVAYADKLGLEKRDLLFIAPSVFEAKKWRWSQDAYMAMWYRVLGEMVGNHFMMPGWEYSTGGVKEVLFSLYMQWNVIGREMSRVFEDVQTVYETVGIKDFLVDVAPGQFQQELEEMRKIRIHSPSGIDVTNYALEWAIQKVTEAVLDLRKRELPYKDLLDLAWKMNLTWHRGYLPSFYTDRQHPTHSPIVSDCVFHLQRLYNEIRAGAAS
jgi:hypothetical protein